MRLVYSHFPINATITMGGKCIELRNYLGEKRALLNDCTWQHIDDTYTLLTQVVAEFDALPALRDRCVDGEVGVHQAHRVTEFLLDAVEEIADVTAARLESGQLLALGEVHSDADFLARVGEVELDRQVLEVARQGAVLTRHLHNLGLDLNLDAPGHLEDLLLLQSLHGDRWSDMSAAGCEAARLRLKSPEP